MNQAMMKAIEAYEKEKQALSVRIEALENRLDSISRKVSIEGEHLSNRGGLSWTEMEEEILIQSYEQFVNATAAKLKRSNGAITSRLAHLRENCRLFMM